ncbi:hypothetical protein GQP18_26970 [Vibrio parahaemolyticus]|nr:hypothetical protein [Vibrio parahaemolyticus]
MRGFAGWRQAGLLRQFNFKHKEDPFIDSELSLPRWLLVVFLLFVKQPKLGVVLIFLCWFGCEKKRRKVVGFAFGLKGGGVTFNNFHEALFETVVKINHLR